MVTARDLNRIRRRAPSARSRRTVASDLHQIRQNNLRDRLTPRTSFNEQIAVLDGPEYRSLSRAVESIERRVLRDDLRGDTETHASLPHPAAAQQAEFALRRARGFREGLGLGADPDSSDVAQCGPGTHPAIPQNQDLAGRIPALNVHSGIRFRNPEAPGLGEALIESE